MKTNNTAAIKRTLQPPRESHHIFAVPSAPRSDYLGFQQKEPRFEINCRPENSCHYERCSEWAPPPHPPPRSTNNYNKISIRGEKASHTYTPESQEPAHSRGNYLWIGDVKEFFREINTRLSLCSVTPVALFCKSCCLCMKVQVIKVPRCQCESSFVKVLLVLEKMDSVFKCLWSM